MSIYGKAIYDNPKLALLKYGNVLYVSKSGIDKPLPSDGVEYWGLNPEEPFLTISRAIQSADVGYAIEVVGGGVFEEDILVPSNVWLYAPSAILRGSITIGSCTIIDLNWHLASRDDQVLVRNIGCTNRSFYRTKIITGRSGASAYQRNVLFRNEVSAGVLTLDVGVAYVSVDGDLIHPAEVIGGVPLNLAIPRDNFTGNTSVVTTLNNPINVCESEPLNRYAEWDRLDGAPNGHWIQYDFGAPVTISSYEVSQRMGGRAPRGWSLYASNDPADFAFPIAIPALDVRALVGTAPDPAWENNVPKIFNIAAPIARRYYRIVWQDSYSASLVRINWLRMLSAASTMAGGKMTFNIGEVRLDAGSTGIISSSPECDYQGTIRRVVSEPGVVNAIGFNISDGVSHITGNSCLVNNRAYSVTGGSLYLGYQEVSGTRQEVAPGVVYDLSAEVEEINALLDKTRIVAVTSAANVGDVALGAVGVQRVIVTSVELRAVAPITADLTHAEVFAGPGGLLTLIDNMAGIRANFLAAGSSVAWVGSQILDVGDPLVLTLTGTGPAAVDFEVIIRYQAIVAGGVIS